MDNTKSEQKIILEKYRLIEEIGKGGMSRVYKAEDLKLARTVAIKELVIGDLIEEDLKKEIVARFKREAQSAAALNHPNIVTIFDVIEEDNRHYISMEYACGKTLKDLSDENYQYTLNELLDVLIQIASGMEHAHSKGIIHRDIKPDNIKIIEDNTIKIMDFGIASMENKKDASTKRGALIGTLGYISPEQLYNSNLVDNRSDIFSFGVMLYEMFTKKLPFDGENIGEIIMNIMTATPLPPSKYNINIHPTLEKMIMKCLDKDPEKRYNKFKEISSELMLLKLSEATGDLNLNDSIFNLSTLNELTHKLDNKTNTSTPFLAYKTRFETNTNSLEQNIEIVFFKSFGKYGSELGEFSSPRSIFISEDLYLYVCDTKNSRVQVFNSKEKLYDVISFPEMKSPCSLAIDYKTKNIYILDADDCKIRVFDQDKNKLFSFGGIGDNPWKFKGASSICIVNNNKVYVTDTKDSKIKIFTLQGQYLTSFGKNGEASGEYKAPYNIVFDGALVYVLDDAQPRVNIIDKAGIPQFMFGERGTDQGKLTVPKGIAVDERGRIYVSENLTHRVQIFNNQGKFIYSFGKKGSTKGSFSDPEGICISPQNKIYVLDRGNNRIQVFKYLT